VTTTLAHSKRSRAHSKRSRGFHRSTSPSPPVEVCGLSPTYPVDSTLGSPHDPNPPPARWRRTPHAEGLVNTDVQHRAITPHAACETHRLVAKVNTPTSGRERNGSLGGPHTHPHGHPQQSCPTPFRSKNKSPLRAPLLRPRRHACGGGQPQQQQQRVRKEPHRYATHAECGSPARRAPRPARQRRLPQVRPQFAPSHPAYGPPAPICALNTSARSNPPSSAHPPPAPHAPPSQLASICNCPLWRLASHLLFPLTALT
jgi:hypothetical protein